MKAARSGRSSSGSGSRPFGNLVRIPFNHVGDLVEQLLDRRRVEPRTFPCACLACACGSMAPAGWRLSRATDRTSIGSRRALAILYVGIPFFAEIAVGLPRPIIHRRLAIETEGAGDPAAVIRIGVETIGGIVLVDVPPRIAQTEGPCRRAHPLRRCRRSETREGGAAYVDCGHSGRLLRTVPG
jgi:hypothetical protein